MSDKKEFSTIEAAAFLQISRQRFWVIRDAHKLKPIKQFGKTSVYALKDLLRVQAARACK